MVTYSFSFYDDDLGAMVYDSRTVFAIGLPGRGEALGLGSRTAASAYFDLAATSAPIAADRQLLVTPNAPDAGYVTSLGALVIKGSIYTNTATMTRTAAAVPEPGQVALGLMAAGYALLTAGRRYRARRAGVGSLTA